MKVIISILIFILLFSCKKEKQEELSTNENKVLLLKVNSFTHEFEGGKELIFSNNVNTFTITHEYQPPLDFGSIKFKYHELNETFFHGTIIYMGLGKILYPQDWLSPNQFDTVANNNVMPPPNNFQRIFPPDSSRTLDSSQVWLAIQKLRKVREYVLSNPNSTMKIFYYNPGAWPTFYDQWIIILNSPKIS